jgi:hypothetical protein
VWRHSPIRASCLGVCAASWSGEARPAPHVRSLPQTEGLGCLSLDRLRGSSRRLPPRRLMGLAPRRWTASAANRLWMSRPGLPGWVGWCRGRASFIRQLPLGVWCVLGGVWTALVGVTPGKEDDRYLTHPWSAPRRHRPRGNGGESLARYRSGRGQSIDCSTALIEGFRCAPPRAVWVSPPRQVVGNGLRRPATPSDADVPPHLHRRARHQATMPG